MSNAHCILNTYELFGRLKNGQLIERKHLDTSEKRYLDSLVRSNTNIILKDGFYKMIAVDDDRETSNESNADIADIELFPIEESKVRYIGQDRFISEFI